MGAGSLSSKVKNMKFMQTADDRRRQLEKDTAETEKNKKIKDLSEWSLPVSNKTLKVIKKRGKKVRKIGYSTISSLGPVNTGSAGRKIMTTETNAPDEKPKETSNDLQEESIESDELAVSEGRLVSKKKSKKAKKSKKKDIMSVFEHVEENDDNGSNDEITKNLLELWNKNGAK